MPWPLYCYENSRLPGSVSPEFNKKCLKPVQAFLVTVRTLIIGEGSSVLMNGTIQWQKRYSGNC
jgi:hypothetical protein